MQALSLFRVHAVIAADDPALVVRAGVVRLQDVDSAISAAPVEVDREPALDQGAALATVVCSDPAGVYVEGLSEWQPGKPFPVFLSHGVQSRSAGIRKLCTKRRQAGLPAKYSYDMRGRPNILTAYFLASSRVAIAFAGSEASAR